MEWGFETVLVLLYPTTEDESEKDQINKGYVVQYVEKHKNTLKIQQQKSATWG